MLFVSLLVSGQQSLSADFKRAQVDVSIFPETQKVIGSVEYEFDILKDIDTVYIDAKDFDFVEVDSQQGIKYEYDGGVIKLIKNFKKENKYKVLINWQCFPKKAMYFVGWDNDAPNQIWTQGQGKYTSNWLPSFDDMNEKVEFDISISTLKGYEVISNGVLTLKSQDADKRLETWRYNMEKPMSSYLVALAIGKYSKKIEVSKSGISLEMYFYPQDSLMVEPTYRYAKQMFDYLEEEIGVSYPWQNYKQVPVHDFLYSGMENTSLTIFSDALVTDSIGFNDRNYINVNAHELAHQWFGNLVTETTGTHHWLQEGFATYYALLAERQVFNQNYYYWRLYEYAQELLEQDSRGQGTSLLDPKSSSATFYKRGAWVLHALKDLIGEDVFKEGVYQYLNTYQYQNVETSDFFEIIERLYGNSLDNFVSIWLEADVFPYNEAMASLEQSVFIQEYLMADCEAKTAKCDYYLSASISPEAKAKIISQVPERVTVDVFNDELKVRQALAQHLLEIPMSLKVEYESLLDDDSYITIESALYNLWVNFPNSRKKYLDKTKSIIGFSDKNVRLLWLVLAMSTPDYEDLKKQDYYDELVDYASENYSFEVRQAAFSYLDAIGLFNDEALESLWRSTKHFNWRFKSFSRDLLSRLSDDIRYREKIIMLKSNN